MKATEKRVDWAYEVWDELLEMLTDKDNHVRGDRCAAAVQPGAERPQGPDAEGLREAAAGDAR